MSAVVQKKSQSTAAYVGQIPVVSITLDSPVTKGNLVVMIITDVEGEESSIATGPVYAPGGNQWATGPYDSQGNSYSLAVETNAPNNPTLGSNAAAIFYTIASATGTLTVHYGDARFANAGMTVWEVQGGYDTLDATGVFINVGAFNGTDWSVSTNSPTLVADEFVLAVFQAEVGGFSSDITWTPMAGVEATAEEVLASSPATHYYVSAFSEAFEVTSKGVVTATATGTLTGGSYPVQPALIVTFYNKAKNAVLTPLATVDFNQANVSPLPPPWQIDGFGSSGLQTVSDACEAISLAQGGDQLYVAPGGTPNDQYASVTVTLKTADDALYFWVRSTNGLEGYQLFVQQGTWALSTFGVGGEILGGTCIYHDGDTYTLGAIGNTIFVLQNGVLLGSIFDTTFTSGVTVLGLFGAAALNNASVSKFVMGSVSLPAPLAITTTSLPNGVIGQAYSQTLAATGGTAPYTWSLPSGSLPAGLSLNASTGVISGTPTAGGNFSITVQVTDASSPAQTDTKSFSFDVVGPAPLGGGWANYQKVIQQRPQAQPPRPWYRPKV